MELWPLCLGWHGHSNRWCLFLLIACYGEFVRKRVFFLLMAAGSQHLDQVGCLFSMEQPVILSGLMVAIAVKRSCSFPLSGKPWYGMGQGYLVVAFCTALFLLMVVPRCRGWDFFSRCVLHRRVIFIIYKAYMDGQVFLLLRFTPQFHPSLMRVGFPWRIVVIAMVPIC